MEAQNTNAEIDDLEINGERLKENMVQLKNIRVYGALNAGALTGIFGFDGMIGFLVYIGVFLVVSLCLALKMQFKVKDYFKSSYEAYYGGAFTDLLLYLMVWVIFHNLVNIL